VPLRAPKHSQFGTLYVDFYEGSSCRFKQIIYANYRHAYRRVVVGPLVDGKNATTNLRTRGVKVNVRGDVSVVEVACGSVNANDLIRILRRPPVSVFSQYGKAFRIGLYREYPRILQDAVGVICIGAMRRPYINESGHPFKQCSHATKLFRIQSVTAEVCPGKVVLV